MKSKNKNYSKFEDTIKHFPYDKWIEFIQEIKLMKDRNRKRNILVFEMLLSTGMRIREFSLIQVKDVDFQYGLIDIPKINTKTSQRRVVRVNKKLLVDLQEYLSEKKIKSGYIFTNKKREALNVRTYQKMFEKYFITYGLQKKLNLDFTPHPHTIRHNMVHYSLQNGIPINAVMAQAGHKDITTTQIYLKLAGAELVREYNNVDF